MTSNPIAGADCRTATSRQPALAAGLSLNITSRSRHSGGVNSLFCDGHVQFIKDTINVTTWQGLGSRNGGEVISADSY